MTPERVAEVLDLPSQVSSSYGDLVVQVPADSWEAVVGTARDELGLTFFDLLTAVDHRAMGFEVVLRLWSVADRWGLRLSAWLSADEPALASLAGVFAGARWHERQVAELFGISFLGHPGLDPLLLPAGFVGHPLRKQERLTARVATPWPGAKEPGESDADLADGADAAGARPRRKNLPLGVTPEDVR